MIDVQAMRGWELALATAEAAGHPNAGEVPEEDLLEWIYEPIMTTPLLDEMERKGRVVIEYRDFVWRTTMTTNGWRLTAESRMTENRTGDFSHAICCAICRLYVLWKLHVCEQDQKEVR